MTLVPPRPVAPIWRHHIFGRRRGQCGPIPGQCWPELVNFGQPLTDCGPNQPEFGLILVEVGPVLVAIGLNTAEICFLPKSARCFIDRAKVEFGPLRAKVGRFRPNVGGRRSNKFHRVWADFVRFRATSGQIWSSSGYPSRIWLKSAEIGPFRPEFVVLARIPRNSAGLGPNVGQNRPAFGPIWMISTAFGASSAKHRPPAFR